MSTRFARWMWISLGLLVAAMGVLPVVVHAHPQLVVTVQDLIDRNHRIEVEAGTEVPWRDGHFERIWFPPAAGLNVRRGDRGFATIFDSPGRYDGRFTIIGGRSSTDVDPLIVIVRQRVD